ncbi:MAG: hypothetical protein IJW81_05280, partial [Clostridia bacterium]|nr:hypothetical protein [Clostridia bacterium]
ERTKSYFANIAPVIDKLAEDGHPTAADILWKSADVLSDDAATAIRRTGKSAVEIALTGGHITHSDTLRLNFEQTLRLKVSEICSVTFRTDEPDPAFAAYRLYMNT